MKALGLVVSDKIFENCNLKTYLFTPWPTNATNWMVWTTLTGDHPGIIPVKFGQIPISGSREDVIWSFLYIFQREIVEIFKSFILKTYLLTQWPTYATNYNGLNSFGRGPPRNHSC